MGDISTTNASTSELTSFLEEVTVEHKLARRARVILALDATYSRSPTWDMAANLTASMLREAASLGSLDVQLAFYRGVDEVKASGWVSDPAKLTAMMTRVHCASGGTQIERILTHAINETRRGRVNALVFIGDCAEENPDILVSRARELGRSGVKAFMFQEGNDALAKRVFQDIATSTGGAYGAFDSGAAKQLGGLLSAIALYAVGGVQALEGRKDRESALLLQQMRKFDRR
jgi:hypothetical protein